MRFRTGAKDEYSKRSHNISLPWRQLCIILESWSMNPALGLGDDSRGEEEKNPCHVISVCSLMAGWLAD